ncbi:hypothetical protein RBE51_20645 [Pseudomonas taiwanensis]|uniref:hypothetical protein n=1 Tax=Pseudomonas taiwanensis TaxID=470150 RepID=UPI0028DFC322|nr:hypothetical protein [Pseudomonas taiwanensis]MDT8925205.1 hypothetical protein [Pseudomonas taiwanensis]
MKTYHDIIPLARHTLITDVLKRGCRDVYNVARGSEGKTARDIPLTNTVDMDAGVLQCLVSFLTFEKVDYSQLVDQHKSAQERLWARFGGSKLLRKPHDYALMDLRRHIASQDSIPWLESHVHFWRDLDVLYKAFDETDQREMDAFFDLLMGKPYAELVSEFSIKVDKDALAAANVLSNEHHYTSSLHLDSLIRGDCACSLFSMTAGSQISQTPEEQEYREFYDDFFYFNHGYGDDFGNSPGDGSADVKGHEFRSHHPRLKDFEVENPGKRFETLADALLAAFRAEVNSGYKRLITIRFLGEVAIKGELQPNSFTVTTIQPSMARGTNLTKEFMLEAIVTAEQQAGFDNRMDDFLAIELGL